MLGRGITEAGFSRKLDHHTTWCDHLWPMEHEFLYIDASTVCPLNELINNLPQSSVSRIKLPLSEELQSVQVITLDSPGPFQARTFSARCAHAPLMELWPRARPDRNAAFGLVATAGLPQGFPRAVRERWRKMHSGAVLSLTGRGKRAGARWRWDPGREGPCRACASAGQPEENRGLKKTGVEGEAVGHGGSDREVSTRGGWRRRGEMGVEASPCRIDQRRQTITILARRTTVHAPPRRAARATRVTADAARPCA